ncbi:UDP-N-acetylmuramoylalanyl-D-glutamate--2,6-diaminopimelate ligase [Lishizhenia tianjinensis]|uniref:UDP-N-acetylmuramoyl-L-alanyl-D-glutamate--2,6-diaminopimelate ligase n=1 Tax=Lishizhenia tianjinensis TaxID=477690 RepID=A0A1I6ZZA5_9FLAO|nr:UDP-N-acetylmuramoyl-L-alanyl-D-glutamate--2,6-diaminopimelate ligase [Lishizhenia tianjinensis]SFT67981.1 UDP-N-acetylmuramoylalanyl-D-glutamate--2,6-diaminopimelate ligase [Lishizhenia tianjinensis]
MQQLRDILYGVNLIQVIGSTDVAIEAIVFDSRKATANTVFVAIKGFTVDGHNYISKAIELGCTSIICEAIPTETSEGVNYIQVKDSHQALALMANNFYDEPSKKLTLVGITGTNGKTTCTTLLHKLFTQLGYKVGLLSTVVNKIGDKEIPSTHTTPDAVGLNALLAQMVEEGCTHCFMEVSSHAIHQHRTTGLDFKVGGFTNITHDHLDYHKTFKEYINVKKSFFDHLSKEAFAITNLDDKNGAVMLQNTKAKKLSYSLKSVSDFKAKVLENQFTGLVLNMNGTELWSRLIGDFNAYNLLLVYAIAITLEEDELEVLTQLSTLESVDGRFQYTKSESGIIAIVDYAHTPDALANVLGTINNIRTKNETVFTVVGCGGDRDKTKRPLMAGIACENSDKVVITSDNPRTENPETIIEEMMTGVEGQHYKKTLSITNRKEAIKTAISMAQPNDIILIAGKGHETYQEINGVKHDFDDMAITKELFKKLDK